MLGTGDVYVAIGGWIGAVPLFAASLNAIVWAFEADPFAFAEVRSLGMIPYILMRLL